MSTGSSLAMAHLLMSDADVNSAYHNFARRYMERGRVEQVFIERFKTFDSWSEPNGLLCERMLRYAMDNSCEILVRQAWKQFTDAEVDEMIEEATVIRSRLHRVHPQDSRMINYKEFVQIMMDQLQGVRANRSVYLIADQQYQ